MLTQRITDTGVKLNIEGDNLSVTSHQLLTEEQRQYIREHKPALLDELLDINKAASSKLQQIAQEQGWPMPDLMDWYTNDLPEMAGMDIETVRFITLDYIKNFDLCRGGGYQPSTDSLPELIPV